MGKTLHRQCAICRTDLEIVVDEDGTYEGGHYFGDIAPENAEYWECDDCYEAWPVSEPP